MRALVLVLLVAVVVGILCWWGLTPISHPAGGPRPADEDEWAPGAAEDDEAPVDREPPTALLCLGRRILEVHVFGPGPWPGAEVELLPIRERSVLYSDSLTMRDPPEPLARLVTDVSGRAVFRSVGSGPYRVRASAENGGRGEATVRPDRGTTVVKVVLRPAREILTGTAVFSDGRPFTARIRIDGAMTVEGRTNDDGAFRFPGLIPGRYRLQLIDPGRRRVNRRLDLPRDGDLRIVVDADFKMLEGRVVAADDGTPVADAAVYIRGGGVVTATTGPDGRFRVLASAEEDLGMEIHAAGFATAREHVRRGRAIEIRLVRRCSVAGRVIDTFGRPVAGVPVSVESREYAGEPVARTVSGEDGRFEFHDLCPGKVTIIARGTGWVSESLTRDVSRAVTSSAFDFRPGPRPEVEIPILVVRTARIEGTVRVAGIGPAAGLPVTVHSIDEWGGQLSASTAVTDGKGRFAFEDLVPGSMLHVTVLQRAGLPDVAGPFVLSTGEVRRFELEIDVPRWVDLTVLDAVTGEAVRMAGVMVRTDPGTGEIHFQTDQGGQVRLGPLPPGPVLVRVDHGRYLCPIEPVSIEGDRRTIELSPALFITGRVVTVDGTPPTPGYVKVVDYESPYDAVTRVKLERGGAFRIGPLPAGTFELEACTRGENTWHKAAAGEDSLLIRLDPEKAADPDPVAKDHGEMTLTWFGPEGDRAISGWTDFHHSGGESPLQEIQESPGRVSYRILRPDAKVWFEIWAAKSPRGEPLGSVVTGPVRVGRGDVRISLDPGRTIEGRVLDPDGKGVEGLSVTAQRLPIGVSNSRLAHGGGRTREGGWFEVTGLGDRPYDLVVSPPKGTVRPDPVRAKAGEKGVVIQLARSATLTVRVTAPDGAPVDRARVVAVREDGKGRPVRKYSSAGVVVLDRLKAGEAYTIRIVGAGDGWAWQGEGLQSGGEEVIARLSPGLAIHGRFEVPEGADRFEVFARLAGCWIEGRVEPDGRFEIRGLTPGRWKVALSVAAGRKKTWSGEAEVAAGAETTLVLKTD